MFLSVFDLFKVGIGPSSSHTVGPMIAARRFLLSLKEVGLFSEIDKIHIDVYGSLAPRGDGKHMVSLDKVIETMRQTGEEMKVTYKETPPKVVWR